MSTLLTELGALAPVLPVGGTNMVSLMLYACIVTQSLQVYILAGEGVQILASPSDFFQALMVHLSAAYQCEIYI